MTVNETIASNACVATDRPALYLRQLCEHIVQQRERHGAPEVEVTFDANQGFVNFDPLVSGTCRIDAGREGVLVLDASGTDRSALERVQRIVTESLERLGRSDGLTVEWTPASEQRSTRGFGLL
jgi:hypothetical protein